MTRRFCKETIEAVRKDEEKYIQETSHLFVNNEVMNKKLDKQFKKWRKKK